MKPRDRPIRVLHVEDAPSFAEVAQRRLEKFDDIEVASENDPREALKRTANGDFDCVVSDYDMPELNGIELLEAVREDRPDLPFILFTGKGSEEVASKAISAGVTDYLQKGGGSETFALLVNRIRNSVDRYQTERELRAQERLSSRIVDASPIAIVVHDLDGDVIFANERANEILGAGASELSADAYESASWKLRDRDGDLVPYEDLPFSRVMGGEELMDEFYTVTTGDGKVHEILVHGAPLRNEDGDIEAAIIPFRLAETDY